MNTPKPNFAESLEKQVVLTGKCVSCGGCVAACPFKCINLAKGKPTLVNLCKKCGICSAVCPQYDSSQQEIERFVFGRSRRQEEEFGIYRRLTIARSTNRKIRNISQDGGISTALLLHALKNGLVDAAIVSSWAKNRPFYPVPVLASTTDQILKSAGTRYSYSPNLLALCEVAKPKTSKIAFVGIPCQIRSIRKMQALGLNKIVKPVKYLLGLMCSESFSYEGLMKRYIGGQQGIKLNQIAKLNIKGKLIVTTKSGTVITTPLSEIKKYRERGCTFCQDFSSELADISVGGLGLRGWTFTIIRTQAGEELFSSAEEASQVEVKSVGDNEAALNLLRRLSCKKRETTQASMS